MSNLGGRQRTQVAKLFMPNGNECVLCLCLCTSKCVCVRTCVHVHIHLQLTDVLYYLSLAHAAEKKLRLKEERKKLLLITI